MSPNDLVRLPLIGPDDNQVVSLCVCRTAYRMCFARAARQGYEQVLQGLRTALGELDLLQQQGVVRVLHQAAREGAPVPALDQQQLRALRMQADALVSSCESAGGCQTVKSVTIAICLQPQQWRLVYLTGSHHYGNLTLARPALFYTPCQSA